MVDDGSEGLPIDPDLDPRDPGQPHLRPGRTVRTPSPRRPGSRFEPDVLAVIAAGGMLGASARHFIAQAFATGPGQVPWATFVENLVGSFLLGLALVVLLERFPPTRYFRPFLATGIFGAFTTMSAYQMETVLLVRDGHHLTALLYSVGSMAAGLVLAYLGIIAARATSRRRTEEPG